MTISHFLASTPQNPSFTQLHGKYSLLTQYLHFTLYFFFIFILLLLFCISTIIYVFVPSMVCVFLAMFLIRLADLSSIVVFVFFCRRICRLDILVFAFVLYICICLRMCILVLDTLCLLGFVVFCMGMTSSIFFVRILYLAGMGISSFSCILFCIEFSAVHYFDVAF